MEKDKNGFSKSRPNFFSDVQRQKKFIQNYINDEKYKRWERDIVVAKEQLITAVISYLTYYQGNYYGIEQQINNMSMFFKGLEKFFLDARQDICHVDDIGLPFHPQCKRLSFNEKNYVEVFKTNNLLIPPVEVITSLHRFLKLRKESGDIGTYTHFKQKHNCNWSIYDNPENFYLFDGNLFYGNMENIKIIHEKNYKNIVLEYNKIGEPKQPQPDIKEFRAISNLIKDYIIKGYNGNVLSCNKAEKRILMNQIVVYLQNEHNMANKIIIDNIYHQQIEKKKVRIIRGNEAITLSLFDQYRQRLKLIIAGVPNNILSCLVSLVDGDIKLIDQLAKMIARINLEKNFDNKIMGVISNNIDNFNHFITLFYTSIECAVPPIEALNLIKYFIGATQLNYNGLMVNLLGEPKSSLSLNEEYFKTLKKLVLSKPIRKNDKKFGKINHINRARYIAVIESASELNKYKEYMGDGLEIIALSNTVDDLLQKIQITENDIDWLHTIFATYGLILLLKRSRKKCQDPTYDKYEVVRQFIKCCCKVSPDVDCYTEDLYAAYVAYFKHELAIEPIKRGELKRLIALDCDVKNSRPRHGENENRRGLKGITVDKANLEKYLATKIDDKKKKLQVVTDYLNFINKEMVTLLGIDTYQKELVVPVREENDWRNR